ncbi:hypothetical protein [Persicirhabdus sediminis]|uniref:Uncharacterized protein n=1 Tax=Persicirhabdus sediminis TaxID=454144 RepID=A0A8J7MEZ7_9BACT|nr:hypothetical protein [Persicirhabdus sediminis]MBK1791497.1 hypothetical protein [Persicirhabdus sediminis]
MRKADDLESADDHSSDHTRAKKSLSWLKASLRCAIGFSILLVVTIVGSHYWMKRSWENYRVQLESRGEILDYQKLVDSVLANHQAGENLADAELLATKRFESDADIAQLFNEFLHINSQSSFYDPLCSPINSPGQYDFTDWSSQFGKQNTDHELAARELIEACKTSVGLLAELAASIDSCSYLLEPHYGQSMAGTMQLFEYCYISEKLASVQLALGETDACIEEIARFNKLSHMYTPASTMVDISLLMEPHRIAANLVWQGLRNEQFTSSQLDRLAEIYHHDFDSIKIYTQTMRAERAWGLGLLEYPAELERSFDQAELRLFLYLKAKFLHEATKFTQSLIDACEANPDGQPEAQVAQIASLFMQAAARMKDAPSWMACR